MKVLSVVGTRPEIIKMAPLLELFDQECEHLLIHSGQHYSAEMDRIFFQELELRAPDANLQVGSTFPARQVAAIIEGVEDYIELHKPDLLVIHGDTNTTLGGAVAAVKYRHGPLPLAHIEAGARSGIRSQVEEINRKLVDQMADLLFAANPADRENLLHEGIEDERIFVTGNTVLESSRRMASRISAGYTQEKFGFAAGSYAVATFHRQESVDVRETLEHLVEAMQVIAEEYPLIIPLHPRTKKRLAEYGLTLRGRYLELMEPLGYRDMIALLRDARVCLTDSGGLQEEAAVLNTPAIVLREKTEHTKYIQSGFHRLCAPAKGHIAQAFADIWENPPQSGHQLSEPPQIAHGIYTTMRRQLFG
jgi:UDP-N-acetylglucosamine 2-epimerase